MNASRVIQNGPAFFDRTSSARSPSVTGRPVPSGMVALRHLKTEHLRRGVHVDYVVEHELVGRAAIDMGGGGGEREAGQVAHGRQWQMQKQRIRDFRDRRSRFLVDRADQ